jgi:hypothetical protein
MAHSLAIGQSWGGIFPEELDSLHRATILIALVARRGCFGAREHATVAEPAASICPDAGNRAGT